MCSEVRTYVELSLGINLIPLQYPVVVIPCWDNFYRGINHGSLNLKVPTMNIEIRL